jgi:outer membrane lipoprotein SlyB
VSLQLLSPVSTTSSKKGDKFNCKILTPAEFAGAVVEGHVRSVKRSGKADKDSKIDLAFDRVTLTDGRTANFSATVLEVFDVINAKDQGRADNEGTIKNKSTAVKTSIKRAAVGALIGALVGGAIAGGQGAAVGAAIGASVGVTTTLAMKGPDLEFKTGTEFTVETDGPSRVAGANAASTSPLPAHVANPSAESRMYFNEFFRVSIPGNWSELSHNPLTIGPAGAFRVNNGRPELTHGLILGIAQPATGTLQEISDRFVEALLKNNARMRKTEKHNGLDDWWGQFTDCRACRSRFGRQTGDRDGPYGTASRQSVLLRDRGRAGGGNRRLSRSIQQSCGEYSVRQLICPEMCVSPK